MKEEKELTPKQQQVLHIFVAQTNTEKACAESGISTDCFYRWLKEPNFKNALQRCRYEISVEAIELLKVSSQMAAATLIELLGKENKPSVRRAAANDILSYTQADWETKRTRKPWAFE